jgi:hypothetical protein
MDARQTKPSWFGAKKAKETGHHWFSMFATIGFDF